MNNRITSNRIFGKSVSAMLAIVTLALVLSASASAAPNQPEQNKPQPQVQPTDTQYFQDIPVGSFFYPFTAALYTQGVVAGFACGTPPAGACVPPDNLPYYVPSGNVTRGQMSIFINNARTKAGLAIDDGTIGASYNISMTNHTAGADALKIRSYGGANYGINVGSQDSYGIYAFSNGANAIRATSSYTGYAAIYGTSSGASGYGLYGDASDSNGTGVYGNGGAYGVYGSSTNGYGVYGVSTGAYGVRGLSTNSYGAYFSSTNNDAADFSGNLWGIYVRNSGAQPAADIKSYTANSYGALVASDAYVAEFVTPPSTANGFVQLRVDGTDPTLFAERVNNGALYVAGNLTVGGSKSGYVVDLMKNASGETLEPGDVVVIAADSSAAVLGEIPVPSIKKASAANDSGVVGIVDVPMYVPDAATAAAYAAQTTAEREAAASVSSQNKTSPQIDIKDRITDERGLPHQDKTTNVVAAGAYANVVTLGAYKAVKVDASFGPIKAGDLLTSSPHAGYAMKVKDKAAASGAVIGKALSSLDSGTGTVTVLVTLK